jgi:predicted CopG family antitoxin
MAAKTVALDAEAYALLAKAKRSGETFSDVVKRRLGPRRPITDFAGIWKDIPAAELATLERWRRESRKKDQERQERLNALWK